MHSTKKQKFLIVSNLRSGSTWLEMMLGELYDIYVDYEFKWSPKYKPHPVHYVIADSHFSCGNILDEFGPSPVVGSKLTFDDVRLSKREYAQLFSTIDPDIKIIHLTRNYYDIINSLSRGILHLQGRLEKTKDTTIAKEITNFSLHPNFHAMLYNTKKKKINAKDCYNRLFSLLQNDIWIHNLRKTHSYIRVDYAHISTFLPRIIDFVGSSADKKNIDMILLDPPTKKLPKVNAIKNDKQIRRLSFIFQTVKQYYFLFESWSGKKNQTSSRLCFFMPV